LADQRAEGFVHLGFHGHDAQALGISANRQYVGIRSRLAAFERNLPLGTREEQPSHEAAAVNA
jgi:hypothetical protein